jgi:hypothetical protein
MTERRRMGFSVLQAILIGVFVGLALHIVLSVLLGAQPDRSGGAGAERAKSGAPAHLLRS